MNTSAVIFQIQSTLIVALLTYGIYIRKNRKKHIKTMLWAIIWDIILIAQIELNRKVIIKAANFAHHSNILSIHIALASATVLLYVAVLWSGIKLMKGDTHLRNRHKFLALTAYTMRIGTLGTSFFTVISHSTPRS